MNQSNRTVLITGGSSGIELGLAEALYQGNCQVINCGRDPEKFVATKQSLPGLTAIRCGVGEARQREGLARKVLQRIPGLYILVNNAGVQRTIDLKKRYEQIRSGEDEIANHFTSVVELTGYSKELAEAWRTDRAGVIASMDARRQGAPQA